MAEALAVQTDVDADWQDYVPSKAKTPDRRSALVKARERFPNEIINACPYNRDIAHLDERTYCQHLVGFTPPEEGINPHNRPRHYHPQRLMPGPDGKVKYDRRGNPTGAVFTDGSDPQDVLDTDFLVLGTTCFRVYRRDAGPIQPARCGEQPEAIPEVRPGRVLADVSDE